MSPQSHSLTTSPTGAYLWSSWAILGKEKRVWFGGDTGYMSVPRNVSREEEIASALKGDLPTCPAFAEIGDHLGPFDLSLIPIGAYEPRFFMSPVHMNPWDAVRVHRHVKSKKSIGCHWGAWVLTEEPIDEPPRRLVEEAEALGLQKDEFITIPIGSTLHTNQGVQDAADDDV